MVDARLADGSRVNAIIPPLAIDGPSLSIRRFPHDRLDAYDLLARQTLTQPMLDFLQAAIACRLNVVVSGGTGAGKDDAAERPVELHQRAGSASITIEDAAELVMRQRHVVPAGDAGRRTSKARAPSSSGNWSSTRSGCGPIASSWARFRGDETLDMLQAMNTGHDGSLTTIHANTPRDALYRLDNHGRDGQPEHSGACRPAADRVGNQPDHPGVAPGRRHPEGDADLRNSPGWRATSSACRRSSCSSATACAPTASDRPVQSNRRAPKCSERLAAAGTTLPPSLFDHLELVA